MAFGEVLGFVSAMFAPVGRWPQSPRSDSCCLCASGPDGPPVLSPVQQQQQPGQGDSLERVRPETRSPADQSGGENEGHEDPRTETIIVLPSGPHQQLGHLNTISNAVSCIENYFNFLKLKLLYNPYTTYTLNTYKSVFILFNEKAQQYIQKGGSGNRSSSSYISDRP